MSENERDSHFAGFANLLYEDFLQLARDDEHDINEMLAPDYPDKWRATAETLIAQRAYDLALHTVKNIANVTGPPELAFVDIWGMMEHYTEIVVADVPDLTEWPEH